MVLVLTRLGLGWRASPGVALVPVKEGYVGRERKEGGRELTVWSVRHSQFVKKEAVRRRRTDGAELPRWHWSVGMISSAATRTSQIILKSGRARQVGLGCTQILK